MSRELEDIFQDPGILKLLDSAITGARRSVDRITRRIPGVAVTSPNTLARFREQNVGLIRTISQSLLGDVQEVLEANPSTHVKGLAAALQERFSVNESRGKFWARDQTLKLHAKLTQERQRKAGGRRYIWTASDDERTREIHADLDGQVFEWSDPPVTNEAGDRNHPGEDYNCRCTAYPIFDDPIESENGALA